MENEQLKRIVSHFETVGTVDRILPLGNGLINDTYRVVTQNHDNMTMERLGMCRFYRKNEPSNKKTHGK